MFKKFRCSAGFPSPTSEGHARLSCWMQPETRWLETFLMATTRAHVSKDGVTLQRSSSWAPLTHLTAEWNLLPTFPCLINYCETIVKILKSMQISELCKTVMINTAILLPYCGSSSHSYTDTLAFIPQRGKEHFKNTDNPSSNWLSWAGLHGILESILGNIGYKAGVHPGWDGSPSQGTGMHMLEVIYKL